MSDLQPVLWSEGLLLSQQHFQSLERALLTQWQWYIESLSIEHWGVSDLSLNHWQLQRGVFSLSQLNLLLPDKRWVSFDEKRRGFPLTCELQDSSHDIYIQIPKGEKAHGLSGYDKPKPESSFYLANYERITDSFDSDRQHEVALGDYNLSVTTKPACQSQYSVLLATVRKQAGGSYELVSETIPPILTIRSSKIFMERLSNCIQQLAIALAIPQNQLTALSTDESLLCRYQLVQLLQKLKRFEQEGCAHPKRVLLTFDETISSLHSLLFPEEKTALLLYQHNNLAEVFTQIESRLAELLVSVLQPGSEQLPFKQESSYHWSVELPFSCFNKANWFLKVDANEPVANEFMQQVKLGATPDIHLLVSQGLSGLSISQDKSRRDNWFVVNQQSKHWQRVRESQSLSLHIKIPLAIDSIVLLAS